MYSPLLATKLYLPPPRPKVVHRPRLTARLNEGLNRRLTLISAPAGFGKTTLVSEWVAGSKRPLAWLSLDEGDNDPTRFLAYLVAALQTIAPHVGAGVSGLLQGPQVPPTESILATLLNEIAALPDDLVLVLDDYHLIDAKPVDLALTFLLEHLPPQMHLVMTTREDPDLPLARLRARGQLLELRATDLSFTPLEAAEFLTGVMGLDLSAESIALLDARIEGWAAGLQMAALSMQGRPDTASFIREFTGTHRFVLDYLIEEVLQRQPTHVRSFLLQTSILEGLHGPLCNAVTGHGDGSEMLEALERSNLFVVSLDEKRLWYRYHHLFAEVLSVRLLAEQPDQVALLHRRASEWYEQNGRAADAIRHALAAQEDERAADLVERALPAMRRAKEGTTFLGWLKALPDELIRCRPVLSVGYAWALLESGELQAVETRLRDAERWLNMTAAIGERPEARSTGMVVVDEEEFRRLPSAIAIYRAARAQALGDLPGTVMHARRVLELVPEEEHLVRGAAAGLLGLAHWSSGDLEAAHRAFADGMVSLQRAGHISDAISGATVLADIRVAQSRLHEAMRIYEQSLQLAEAEGDAARRAAAGLYVGMSELLREQNDLNGATQSLLRSKELGERTTLPQNRYRWYVAMARIREAQGDLDGALDLLHQAERLYVRELFPNVRPVAALQTRVWLRQGRLDRALAWVCGQRLSPSDDLSYLHEFEQITLARVLLARHTVGSLPEAMGLLERLRQAADDGARMGSVIEILVLQALAHQMHGDVPAALIRLQQALTLAEPEGYVRIFVDEGLPMAALLKEALKGSIAPNYVRQLLTAFGKAEERAPVRPSLTEPLSEREREVLRLLGTELSGPEIARQLVVSLNTVRTHTQHIYEKLGVTNRRAAVRRAEELDLL